MKCVILLSALVSFSTYARNDEGSARPPSEQVYEVTRAARLDSFVNHFNKNVKSGADIERELLFNAKPAVRKEMSSFFKKLGKAPQLIRDGQQMIMRFPEGDLPIFFVDKTNKVVLGGDIFVFDPTAPWKPQLAKMSWLNSFDKKQASLWDWIVPEANAAGVGILKAGAKVGEKVHESCGTKCGWAAAAIGGYTVPGAAYNFGCWSISWGRPWENVGICEDWKTARDARAAKTASEAASRAKQTPSADWIADQNAQCPKGESFSGLMQEKSLTDPNFSGPTFRFYAKTKDSVITSAYIFDDLLADTRDPERNASIKLVYDQETPPNLVAVHFKRANRNPNDPSDDGYTPYYLSDDPSVVEPDFRNRLAKMAQFAAAAQRWSTTCQTWARAGRLDPAAAVAAAQNMATQPVKVVPPTVLPAAGETPSASK